MSEEQQVVATEAAEEVSTQDIVRAAFEESSEEVTEDKAVSNRDESGRFKGKTAEEPAPITEVPEELPPGTQGKWSVDRPPSGWTPKARENWGALPLDIRQEIIRREENALVGVQKLQSEYAPLRELRQHMEPVLRELHSIGVNPSEHLDRVMNTERVLRTADLPTKFDALMSIADDYGIPLRDIINRSVGQEVLRSPQQGAPIHPEIQRELAEIRGWREEQQQAMVANEVMGFGSQQEFFHDARYAMADLIERGLASSLQDAYEKAIWMIPDVRDVLMDRKTRGSAGSAVQNRQAKAVGTSVRPSGSLSVAVDDGDDSISGELRKAFAAQTGRL